MAVRLFDTHCHFETADATSIAETLRRARSVGVERVMVVGGSAALNESARAAAAIPADETLPRIVCALGFDREQVGKVAHDAPPCGADERPAAVGEIGLDYHYSPETRAEQMKLFAGQLDWAKRMDLPVVIHTREADDDTIALLREIPSRGIIHCYTGGPQAARAFLDLGFYISFSGIVTFRAAENVRESARVVPDDRILIETDSPFLAPVPMRGKPNEPAFVRHTCAFLAEMRGMTVEGFSELTFENGVRAVANPRGI